jgi:hypothetical protein
VRKTGADVKEIPRCALIRDPWFKSGAIITHSPLRQRSLTNRRRPSENFCGQFREMIPVKRFKVVSIALFLLLLVFGRATTSAQSTANAKRPERQALPETKPPLPITKHMKPPGPYTDDDFLVGDYAEDYCCGTLYSTHPSPPAGSIRRTGLTIKGRGVVTSITPVQLDGWSAVVGIAGKRQHQPLICTFDSRAASPNDVPSFILNGVRVGDTVVVNGHSLDEDTPLNGSEMKERAEARQSAASTPHFRCTLKTYRTRTFT